MIVLLVLQYIHPTPPRYYAYVDSISGVRDDWRMQISLALGVESWSPLWGRVCLPRGTAVEVAYHGVTLGYGDTGEEACVRPWELWTVRKTTVLAGRIGVGPLPEFVVEGLVADMRRGVQVFDVTLRIPSTRQDGAKGDGDGKLASCMARLGRDGKADACDVHYS
jgi:hypothetical protein